VKSRILAVSMFAFLLWLSGCAPQVAVSPEPKRTAEQEYERGMQALSNGDWENAARSFNQAIKRNSDFGRGYSGLGLVLATRGELDKALEYADKGLTRERTRETLVVKAEILTIAKPEQWLDRCIELYDEAISKHPRDKELVFQKADVLFNAGEYKKAFDVYDELGKSNWVLADSARQQATRAFHYYKAQPQSETAEKVLLQQEITRADLAALLVDELNLVDIFNKKRQKSYTGGYVRQIDQVVDPEKITDIAEHWAYEQIKLAAQTGAMDVFPDFTFRPNEIVTRKDLAMVLQNVLVMATGNQRIATRYAGKSSPFYDVNKNHYAFNAINLAVDRELMSYHSQTSEFELNKPVSGASALLALHALAEQL